MNGVSDSIPVSTSWPTCDSSCDRSCAISRWAEDSRSCRSACCFEPRMEQESTRAGVFVCNARHFSTRVLPRLRAIWALRVHLVDRGERDVRRARSLLDRLSPTGESVKHTYNPHDLASFVAQALQRVHGGATSRDDVLDHQAAVAVVERRAFDPALQAVLLAVLADEERLRVGAAGERSTRDRIGAHRRAADSRGTDALRLSADQLGQGVEAGRQQDRAFDVDVVLRGLATRQRHLPDHECVFAQRGDQRVVCRRSQGALILRPAMAAFDGLKGAARTATELAGRARDPAFILNARRTLLPLPLVDRPQRPPRPVFPATRARPALALQHKRVAVAGGAGGGRTVALIGVACAFEEARVEPALVSACSGSVLWAAMWAAGLSAREMADFSLSWRPQDYLGIQWARAPRAAIAAARGFTGLAKGRALESLFDRRLWHMTAGETEFPLRTLVYNVSRRRLETFGTEHTPELRLGELVRIAMAAPAEAVRVEGNLYVDGGMIERQPATRLMIERFDHVFALDVGRHGDIRGDDRLTPIEPFDDLVSSGMDLYDLFIDRRKWPELMLAGYRAARDAFGPFSRRPAQPRTSSGRKAAGS